uniref:CNNM transmembrane domain-containing protein n=1 Tax=Oryza brachyantha TaxID=4533 RepID=J3MC44_ORYBR
MELVSEVAFLLLCVAVGGAGMVGPITEALEEGAAVTGSRAAAAGAPPCRPPGHLFPRRDPRRPL